MKVFKEEQRFTQWWLIALISLSTIIPLAITISEYNKGEKTLKELIIVVLIMLFASSLIFIFKLNTRIDEIGIHFNFFPIYLKYKTITWSEIEKVYVRTYEPIGEYGGWGIKGVFWKSSKGIAYNISGDTGIQLILKNGKKILIGTNKENDAKQILKTYQSKIAEND